MKRHATAVWNGTGKEGSGHISTQTGILNKTQYGFKSRFEDGPGTNPEELIAAAHAGCFTMKLSFNVTEAGFTPEEIQTTAHVLFENGAIPSVHLDVTAKVTGMSEDQFHKLAVDAKENCPVSKLLRAEITMNATLLV